jgi:hypothetical protein
MARPSRWFSRRYFDRLGNAAARRSASASSASNCASSRIASKDEVFYVLDGLWFRRTPAESMPEPAALGAAAARWDIEILGPPGTLPS